ncbi:hypothetical protein ANCCAN_02762 [Ancylostoma caninum]|uniref:Vinculin n=1 Tax=Ancylostoma caninum TaxID=29170 RepID=A0A368H3L0_ANCCA|nr:hypothetical protein ANCCAN_02762 [Ancylostoma caninum]
MRRYTNRCEDAIANSYPQGMVDNTSQIARLGNRVLMAAQNEADNSEEPAYCDRVNSAANQVRAGEFIPAASDPSPPQPRAPPDSSSALLRHRACAHAVLLRTSLSSPA